jgi:hypothetical protein
MRTQTRSVALTALLGLVVAACGTQRPHEPRLQQPQLAIYDADRAVRVHVTMEDVVRSSARAEPGETAMSGLLYFRLKREGILKLGRLTRALADRGKRTHRMQRFAVEIDHHVYARPAVDYRVYPMGLNASQGLQVSGLTFSAATRIAREIRRR